MPARFLTGGLEYTLYVRAKNGNGASAWSSLSVGPWLFTLSATANSTSLTLNWTAGAGATSYEVKQGAYGTATTVSSGTSHTFTGLTANTSYTLYMRVPVGGRGWNSISIATLPR